MCGSVWAGHADTHQSDHQRPPGTRALHHRGEGQNLCKGESLISALIGRLWFFFPQPITEFLSIHWLRWTWWLILCVSGLASLVAGILNQFLFSMMRFLIWKMGRVPLLGDFLSLSLFTMLSQFNDNLDLRGFNKDTFWMDCTFPKYKSERFWWEHWGYFSKPAFRVKDTWRPTGWKERKIYRSRPRQSCATAANRKTPRTRALMGE